MRVLKKSWLLALTIICVAFASNARATRKSQHPSAAVVGTVYCDTCFQNRFSKLSHFVPGALVAVECDDANISQRFRTEVKTDKHGQFKVNLPFSVTNHVKKIKKCTVNLVRSNDANCAVASIARTTSLTLKSRKARTNIFSAGFFTFKPLTQPNTCNQKQNNLKDSLKYDPSFPPPLRDPPSSIVPPIDNPGQFTPIPILPRLPPLPQLPINLPPLIPPQESTHKKTSNDLLNPKAFFLFPPLVPNPLQPPPAIIPPVIPSPPPSIFPPIFPSPPPSIFPPILPTPPQPPPSIFPPVIPVPPVSPPSFFPPIPGFTPPVPSPPPPSPVIPFLPPLPPGFPGVPPATTSVQSKDTKHH